MVAFAGASLFMVATQRRYFEYAEWTRGISASIETACLVRSDEGGTLSLSVGVASPAVRFRAVVDRVEFTLARGGKHAGYYFTLPGEMAVEDVAEEEDLQRITVTKRIPMEAVQAGTAAIEAGGGPAEAGGNGAVRLTGDVVLKVSLARGDRLLRVPVSGEVTMADGA